MARAQVHPGPREQAALAGEVSAPAWGAPPAGSSPDSPLGAKKPWESGLTGGSHSPAGADGGVDQGETTGGTGTLVGLPPEHPLAAFDHLDGLGLAVVMVFAVLGVWRGLWWQGMRLVGLAAAVLAAKALGPRLADAASGLWPDLDTRLAIGGAWLAVFLGALVLAVFVGRLGRDLLRAMQLGTLDRLGGLLAGALTGLLLHAALVAVLVQLGPAEWAQRTVHGSRSERLVVALGQQVPLLFDSGTAERVRALLAAPPGQAGAAYGGAALLQGAPNGAAGASSPGAGHDASAPAQAWGLQPTAEEAPLLPVDSPPPSRAPVAQPGSQPAGPRVR